MTHTYMKADVFDLPFADGSVDTIVTDPPWHFQQRVSQNAKAVQASNYALIEDSEMLTAFREMARVLKPGGHLYLFVPERKLSMLLDLVLTPDVPALGLEHFNTIVWAKVRKDGQDLRIGLGHTYRQSYELIVCLSKGHRRALQNRNTPNIFFHEPLGGSKKPPMIYRRLVEASTPEGGTVLDPFAGSDPLGRAELEGYVTVSSDIAVWEDKP